MNENDLLERDLRQLGDQLRRDRSLASTVAARLRDHHSTPVVEVSSKARTRTIAGLTLSLASMAAILAIVVVFRPNIIAFAQIQEQLTAIKTVSLRYQQSILSQDGDEAPLSSVEMRIFIRSDGRMRIESSDGSVITTNRGENKRLTIDPKNQSATVAYVYEREDPFDLLSTLRALHISKSAQRISERTIDGQVCVGFRIDELESVLRVWVSPQTLLPVFAQRTTENLSAPPGEDKVDKVKVVARFADLRFDEPLADELFSVQPPPDYRLIEIGKPPAKLSKVFSTTPQIVPRVGIGPLKFGMSQAAAMQLLGSPDKVDVHSPTVPIDDDTSQIDDIPRPKNARLVILTQFHILSYQSLGLSLTFEVHEGLKGIACRRRVQVENGIEFPGTTAEGIGIGSPVEEVLIAYSQPDNHTQSQPTDLSSQVLYYQKAGYTFALTKEQTVELIGIDDGKENSLRFEWRISDEL